MVTAVLGVSAAGDKLPVQTVTNGKRPTILPDVTKELEKVKWLFSLNPKNHWASLETMKALLSRCWCPGGRTS
jgi:hypothetical protein